MGIKGYRLWFTDLGSPWLIISGDTKFDKLAIVDQSKESIEIVKDHGVSEQVEIKIEALWIVALGEEIVPFQYLKGTANVDLVYYRDSTKSSSIVGFMDSDFIGDLDKKKFLTGYVFTFGCAISWEATLQSTIVLSTTKTEYMATTKAVKVAIWLKGLVGDLGLQHDGIVVFCDSQSTIHLTKNQMYHEITKHIDVKYHFTSEIVSQGTVVVRKVATLDNPVDMMTKLVLLGKFKYCLDLICVCSL